MRGSVDAVMVARAGILNLGGLSAFRRDGSYPEGINMLSCPDATPVVRGYVEECWRVGNEYQNSKYNVLEMINLRR